MKWLLKMKVKMVKSSVTIITIVYNDSINIENTILSCINQSYLNVEYIIIDGGSTDGTKKIIKNYSDKINCVISEPDKGIYDAMNKGINLANGKWVIFMNAGDTFSNNHVLKDFIDKKFNETVVYGNCFIQYENGVNRISKPNSLETLWKGMTFSHQSVFIKNELIKENLFNLNYKFCADFNQLFSAYLKGIKFTHWDYIIANIEAGGVSDAKRYTSTNEVYLVNKRLNPKIRNHFYFIPKIIWGFVVVKIKTILPKNIVKKLIQAKYK